MRWALHLLMILAMSASSYGGFTGQSPEWMNGTLPILVLVWYYAAISERQITEILWKAIKEK